MDGGHIAISVKCFYVTHRFHSPKQEFCSYHSDYKSASHTKPFSLNFILT